VTMWIVLVIEIVVALGQLIALAVLLLRPGTRSPSDIGIGIPAAVLPALLAGGIGSVLVAISRARATQEAPQGPGVRSLWGLCPDRCGRPCGPRPVQKQCSPLRGCVV